MLLSTVGFRSILPPELLDGVIDALAQNDHRLTLAKFPDEKLVADGFVPHVFRECMCDGMLINYNAQIPQAMLDHVEEARLPTVWINSKQAHDCVYPDDFEAGCMAARLLLDAGHRRVAFANFTGYGHYSATDRRDGIVETMRAGGGTCEMLDTPTNRGIPAISAALACLRRPERPTAMVAYTKFEAMPLVEAAHQLGLRIPGEISLLVFDNEPWDWSELGISAVRLPERGLGETAVALLMRRIAQPTVAQQPKAVPFDLIVGATVGSPGGRRMKGNGMGVGVTTHNEKSGDKDTARIHGWDRGLSSDVPEK
jgi:LacI family transcriptional regulator